MLLEGFDEVVEEVFVEVEVEVGLDDVLLVVAFVDEDTLVLVLVLVLEGFATDEVDGVDCDVVSASGSIAVGVHDVLIHRM